MLGWAPCPRRSSTICSRAERSSSRVHAACFSLLSLARSFSTVASRLWILAFATWKMKGEMRIVPACDYTRGGGYEGHHSAFGGLWSRIWAATSQLMTSSDHSRTIPASAAGRLGSYKHCDSLLCLFPWFDSSENRGNRTPTLYPSTHRMLWQARGKTQHGLSQPTIYLHVQTGFPGNEAFSLRHEKSETAVFY